MRKEDKICCFVGISMILIVSIMLIWSYANTEKHVYATNEVTVMTTPIVKVSQAKESIPSTSEVALETTPKSLDKPTIEPYVSLGTFKVTAYCPCMECCGKTDGITATMTHVEEGRTIAADPAVIPYGSTIVVDGHEYIVEDTGGWTGNQVDIYMNTHQEALEYGVQYHEVFISYMPK